MQRILLGFRLGNPVLLPRSLPLPVFEKGLRKSLIMSDMVIHLYNVRTFCSKMLNVGHSNQSIRCMQRADQEGHHLIIYLFINGESAVIYAAFEWQPTYSESIGIIEHKDGSMLPLRGLLRV